MRYILNERYQLCGWKKLPFALRDNATGRSYFFKRDEFVFLFSCDGKQNFNVEELPEEIQKLIRESLDKKVIRPAQEGETRKLTYREYQGVHKEFAHLSITGLCNYRCRHCFQSAPQGKLGNPTKEQLFNIIEQLDECGIKDVSITGGEPLLRPDLYEIFDKLEEHGMLLSLIFSNGKLITQGLLDELKKRHMHPAFQISFDGVGYHDWMRGIPGAEKAALDAMNLLRSNGFKFSLAMCLCRENVGSIRETIKMAGALGCMSIKLQRSIPQGNWLNEPEHYLTLEETFQAYLDYLPQFVEDGCPISIQFEGFFIYDKMRNKYRVAWDKKTPEDKLRITPPCGVIKNSVYVGPNGTIAPCMSMCGAEIDAQFPNLFVTPLKDILTDSTYLQLTEKNVDYILEHNEECKECPFRCQCQGGCRASATGPNGTDYFAIDKTTCIMHKDGWVEKCKELARNLFGEQKSTDTEQSSSFEDGTC